MKARALIGIMLSLILVYSSFAFTNSTVDQVKAKIDAGEDILLLDVREPQEYREGHIQGAINLPWNSGVLREKYASLPKDKPIIVICRSGGRSAAASAFLEEQGYDQILNMVGGMNAWGYDTVTGEEQGPEECLEGPCLVTSSWGNLKASFQIE
jgi:rhodanese-related sulfurtransferase